MTPTITLGVSLKLYLPLDATISWAKEVASLARSHPAFVSGAVRLFILPSLPSLPAVVDIVGDAPVFVGAQDLFWEDCGAYTGGVSGADLVALGCRFVEVGHAERRTIFGDDDEVIRRKLEAAVRNGLIPVLCVGERVEQATSAAAAEKCIAQIESAIATVEPGTLPELVIAYEPEWAIGRAAPAGREHIQGVVAAMRQYLDAHVRVPNTTVIYGGSAKPGLLSQLDGSVDGLFLGRFAHDPEALALIVNEALALA